MRTLLKTYLRRLTNLTSRNRSLVLLKLPSRQFLDLAQLAAARTHPPFGILEQLIARQSFVPLCEYLDPRHEQTNELSKHLGQLQRTDTALQEERGATNLYVGYPMVQGKLTDGTAIRGPLLFFPVALAIESHQKKAFWGLRSRPAEVQMNRSFLLAYAHFNQVPLPDEWLDFALEDFPTEPLPFLTKLYETIRDSPLEINFNQEIFEKTLRPFQILTKRELEEAEKNGELRLEAHAVLGIFPQAASYLAADYETWLATELPEASLDELILPPPLQPRAVREEDMLLPLPVDASQEAAIRAVKQGHSAVVQGPPGTGKSQLIANLLADAAAHGRQALLVCQKRAALDTVAARLYTAGLENFVALVHDPANDRPRLYSQLARQIERLDEYQQQNLGLDAILLERNFAQTCRQLDSVCRQLEELRTALVYPSAAGVSAKELYLSRLLQPLQQVVPLGELFRQFSMADTQLLNEKFSRIEWLTRQVADGSAAASVWAQRRPLLHQLSITQLADLQSLINEIDHWAEAIRRESAAIDLPLPTSYDFPEIDPLLLNEWDVWLTEQPDWEQIGWLKQSSRKLQKEWQKALQAAAATLKTLPQPLPDFQETHWEALHAAVAAAREAAGNPFKKQWFLWQSPHRAVVKSLMQTYGFVWQPASLASLQERLAATEQFHKLRQQLHSLRPLAYPASFQDFSVFVDKQQQLLVLAAGLPSQIPPKFYTTKTPTKIGQLLKNWQLWGHDKKRYQNLLLPYFQNIRVENLLNLSGSEALAYLHTNVDYLQEHDRLYTELSTAEKELLTLLKPYAAEQPLAALAHTNLREHWLAYLEAETPLLKGVSTNRVVELEQQLQQLLLEKQHLSQAIVQINLREQTYKELTKNRLGNTTTYRELYHQVTKKRKIWPVRKLIAQFGHEIRRLVPVWLASPETVSALFPTPTLQTDSRPLDLVIFDEASQCFVEEGVPAILRGKQVVIAGDSQQLPPNALYQIRYDDPEADDVFSASNSLLNAFRHSLPQWWLRSHYRSQSLDLIAFSNTHFYQNKLELIPAFERMNDPRPAIRYHQVAGQWAANQNVPEAEAVLELLRHIPPDKSVGIVTFNYRQAELIERLLIQDAGNLPQQVRVKNIENMQGDEFDWVIFSIGYAPDASGRLHSYFGSLNQAGGENRLNVAITRAREQVVVVASFWPEQLDVAGTLHAGPRLLKAYLQFARQVSDGHWQPDTQQSIQNNNYLTTSYFVRKNYSENLVNALPFADLVGYQNGTFGRLHFTDDTRYHDAPSAKHWHGYLPILLKAKGWSYERHWSRSLTP